MKILLLGGTGRTGKWVLDQALGKGYPVYALVHDPKQVEPVNHPGLQLFSGSPLNKASLKKAYQGCDAIIHVLKISRSNDFPWAPLRTPKNLLSQTLSNILDLPSITSCKRMVICSAWGVSDTWNDIPFWFRWLIDSSNIGPAYLDHERQEVLVRASSLPGDPTIQLRINS